MDDRPLRSAIVVLVLSAALLALALLSGCSPRPPPPLGPPPPTMVGAMPACAPDAGADPGAGDLCGAFTREGFACAICGTASGCVDRRTMVYCAEGVACGLDAACQSAVP